MKKRGGEYMQVGDYVQIIKGANADDPRYTDKQGKIKRVLYEVKIDPRSGDEGTVVAEDVRIVEEPKTEGGENMTEEQKARLAELKAKEETLTEEEKTELAELSALETPAAPESGSGEPEAGIEGEEKTGGEEPQQ